MKTIVVATDLHGQSEAALEYARKLAAAYGARIVLAHGIDPIDYAAVDAVPGRVRQRTDGRGAVWRWKAGRRTAARGNSSHSEIRQGAVAQMLLDVARQYKAGSDRNWHQRPGGRRSGDGGRHRRRTGRQSPCPVLAVAADWNAGEFRPTPGGPVLLAMERNEAAAAAVATAASLAEVFERPLLLLHARPAGAAAGPDPCAITLEEFGLEPSAEFPVRCIVKKGDPADAIVEGINENHPCILVAGVKRDSETPGPHGTAFALLARSRVPVLCVPPE